MCIIAPVSPIGRDDTRAHYKASDPHERERCQLPGIRIEPKLKAKREQRPEAEVIRDLINKGQKASSRQGGESTGEALLRLAKLGEKLQVKAPADLSSRIDEYLYDEK
jgi:hypothetical protein